MGSKQSAELVVYCEKGKWAWPSGILLFVYAWLYDNLYQT